MLTEPAEREIETLAHRYGAPTRWTRRYSIQPERREWGAKLIKRTGEIVLVVPGRKDHIWLHTKRFYPRSVYRLPSGGIHPGEEIETAVAREAFEELGFKPKIERFLGVVVNVFEFDGEQRAFPSYIIQTKPLLGVPQVNDRSEEISDFVEIAVSDIFKTVEQLDSLGPDWQPWGHFRAAPHELVMQALGN